LRGLIELVANLSTGRTYRSDTQDVAEFFETRWRAKNRTRRAALTLFTPSN
jgi:hypothetical protein